MAALRIYNFLSRRKEVFKPLKRGRVGLYTCGPTVYNYAHIGNLRTYIFEDVLRRTLKYAGYKVCHVMNITDVGHLTSDADAGADKIEEEAKKERKSVWKIARFYTRAFLTDIKQLNIEQPHVLVPATRAIPQQIKIIKQLFKKGYAYDTPTAVYFHVPKFKKYQKFPRQPLKQLTIGAREEVIKDSQKRHPADFVLWFKLVGRFKDHIMRWPSPWGKGFPGWHIECSAISSSKLGQPFDIHTGGVDHIFPHHTNEIAQSEGAYAKPLAKYWMEGEFLLINKERMGKSLGNFFTMETILRKEFNPLAFRYLALTAHYRSQLNFTWESLEAAQNSLERLQEFVRILKTSISSPTSPPNPLSLRRRGGKKRDSISILGVRSKFRSAIFDDLDTPQALAVLWDLVRSYHKSASWRTQKYDKKGVWALVYDFDEVLGLGLAAISATAPDSKVAKLVSERENARKTLNFAAADALRKKIETSGWEIQDTKEGPKLKKLK